MSRAGRMSIEDHRAWVAAHLQEFEVPPFNPVIAAAAPAPTSPLTPRPNESAVQMTMARLAVGLSRAEADLVKEVVARVPFNDLERARVEHWAREALTVAALAAERAAQSGTALTNEVLFAELASRWSPAYGKALEATPARRPREMRYETVVEARDDLKASGLRIQQIADIARQNVEGWYRAKRSKGKWRVKADGTAAKYTREVQAPLDPEELNAKRAAIGLPPLERVRGNLLRDGDLPPKIYRRIETDDPKLLEVERVLGKIGIPVPPAADNYVLVSDAKVTAEVEFEPVRSGPRSRRVMDILNEARLFLDPRAVHEEGERLERAQAEVATLLKGMNGAARRRVGMVKWKTVYRFAGSTTKITCETVQLDGQPFLESRATTYMKRPAAEDEVRCYAPEKKTIWMGAPWTREEKELLDEKHSIDAQLHAMEAVEAQLAGEDRPVKIRTQMRQAINRRWHATSFWLEHVGGDRAENEARERHVAYTEEGQIDEDIEIVTMPRGRLFRPGTPVSRQLYDLADHLSGADVSSSQFQILSVFLNDTALEQDLREQSMAERVGPRVWPDDPEAKYRAKAPMLELGYASPRGEVTRRNALSTHEVQEILNAMGEQIARFHKYAAGIAHTVPNDEGFQITDPFDGSLVVWRPIVSVEAPVKSDRFKVMTYATDGRLDRQRLGRQIPPMLTHMMDSAFSGIVVERLHALGIKDLIALFDCWMLPDRYLRDDRRLLERVVVEAGEDWILLLGGIYDRLIACGEQFHQVLAVTQHRTLRKWAPHVNVDWMRELKASWRQRVENKDWPEFRVRPVATWGIE